MCVHVGLQVCVHKNSPPHTHSTIFSKEINGKINQNFKGKNVIFMQQDISEVSVLQFMVGRI